MICIEVTSRCSYSSHQRFCEGKLRNIFVSIDTNKVAS